MHEAMLRLRDFKDGGVWLMMKLGFTTPPRDMARRRLQQMDAEAI